MKVFAIQKAQINTFTPQSKLNNSINQSFITNNTEDKFVSKVAFSGGKSINMLEAEIAELDKKLADGKLTKEAYDKLAEPIRDKIYRLSCDLGLIETGGIPNPAQDAIDNYTP